MGPWKNEILESAEGPGSANNDSQPPLVLAANRTKRPDILHGFRVYEAGWDFTNRNYWAVSSDAHFLLIEFGLFTSLSYYSIQFLVIFLTCLQVRYSISSG